MRSGKLRALLLITLAVILVAAFTHALWFPVLGWYLVKAGPPAPADAVVVLAGDSTGQRILKAAELVKAGFAPVVLVSGPGDIYGFHESDLAIPFAVAHGYPKSYFRASPNESTSTRDEAQDLLADVRRMGAHRIDVVTSTYHTRRAGNVYRQFGADLEIHVVAAPDKHFDPNSWWKDREAEKTLVQEWTKTIAYWFGV